MSSSSTKKIHDLDVDEYLADCVQVYPEALQEEYVRIPADLAYWNARNSAANRNHLVTKMNRERTVARLQIETRAAFEVAGKKATEALVDATVTMSDEYGVARMAEIEAEVEKAKLSGVVDAIRAKRDMLISLGAHVRAEMQGDPSLREMSRGRKLVNE